ncbi:hypothetical protein EV714DRAFT_205880 [Schizophyllum commune]
MSVKRRSTHSIFAAVFRRASGSHDNPDPRSPRTEGTSLSHEESTSILTWSSSHDGWRRRARLVEDNAVPANLSPDSLLFAVTSSGITGDSLWLAVLRTLETVTSSPHEGEQQTASSSDNAEEVSVAHESATRTDTRESAADPQKHVAIDAVGHVWHLDPKDYAVFLDLARAAQAETSSITNFCVAHTVTCQPTICLVLPVKGARADVQDSSKGPALRTVGVSAYNKHCRRLEAGQLGEKRDKQVRSAPKELPAALYEVLGLAQEGIEGSRDSDTNVTALLAVKNALPRSLLCSMYLPPDHASP